jgi:hypothetical protein
VYRWRMMSTVIPVYQLMFMKYSLMQQYTIASRKTTFLNIWLANSPAVASISINDAYLSMKERKRSDMHFFSKELPYDSHDTLSLISSSSDWTWTMLHWMFCFDTISSLLFDSSSIMTWSLDDHHVHISIWNRDTHTHAHAVWYILLRQVTM